MENEGPTSKSVEVATYTAGAPAFMSLLRGSLVAHRGCLVVGGDQGHRELVVFRAQDIEWDGETLTHEGRRYRLGDNVDLGGGLMALQRLKGLRVPSGWADSAEVFVVAPSGP
jgi:hypothetical protein